MFYIVLTVESLFILTSCAFQLRWLVLVVVTTNILTCSVILHAYVYFYFFHCANSCTDDIKAYNF